MNVVRDGLIYGSSPLDGTPLPPVAVTEPAQVQVILEQARQAQVAWVARPVKERAKLVEEAGSYLMSQADRLAATLHRELGKPLTDAYTVDIGSAPELFRYYCHQAGKLLRNEPVHFNRIMFPAKQARVERVPQGVVGLLTPWNYPVSIPLHNLVPALLAGNSVILKPSEYAPRTGALLHELLSAKLPAGLLGLVQGDRLAGEAVVSGVDYVVFVGGTAGGRAVARLAAERLTPVALELGGKDAAIVLEDADLDRAAYGIAWAGYINAGQSCAGVERVYVVEAVAQAFTERLVKLATSLRLGDDTGQVGSVDLGPLSTPQQLQTVQVHVVEALAGGAKLITGGPAEGQFYRPTVLTGVNANMLIMQQETFGPVVPVQVVPDEATAIREANALPYGLTGSVWTTDFKRGEWVARQLKVGVATVNNHMFSGAAPQAVWGGRGNSGYGVQNSGLALLSFTRPKLVAIDKHTTPRELWWLPNDRALHDLGRGVLVTQGKNSWRENPAEWSKNYLKMLIGVAGRLGWQRKRR